MAKAEVVWLRKGQFVGIDSSKHAVVLSTQDEENAVGLSASELLLISLAGCTAVDIVRIMEKKRQPLSKLEIIAEGEKDSEPPWGYEKIKLTYRMRGKNLSPKDAEKAIELSESKYCSVAASLRNQVEINFDLEVIEES
jgi:putative redox protein